MYNEILRGEIFLCDLTGTRGAEQSGVRPCVIVQNNVGNKHSPTVIVVPITSRVKKFIPTHIKIEQSMHLPCISIALCEQIRTIDKSRVIEYIDYVREDELKQISESLRLGLSLR